MKNTAPKQRRFWAGENWGNKQRKFDWLKYFFIPATQTLQFMFLVQSIPIHASAWYGHCEAGINTYHFTHSERTRTVYKWKIADYLSRNSKLIERVDLCSGNSLNSYLISARFESRPTYRFFPLFLPIHHFFVTYYSSLYGERHTRNKAS
jgi:hypothetical protein